MKFSENWLRTFVNPSMDSKQLAHTLTMAGLEVESLEAVAPPFDNVVVAQVVSVEKHPNADRLKLCKVEVGEENPLSIVCGASNVEIGIKVPCARIGANLPGLTIKQAQVRGVDSYGMLCSAKELGLSDEASGLLILPADAPVGKNIREYLDLDDQLFTLKLTPNRGDCLSLTGIAREVSALSNVAYQPIAIKPGDITIKTTRAIHIADYSACPRYLGRVIEGVKADTATPEWLLKRLQRSGLRSINAIVDVANYVMLELGQPLHAFDLSKLHGAIQIRFAKTGEPLLLLNGQNAELDSDMLIIADEAKALAVAGIMGGEESAVSQNTRDLFLESAFFSPEVVAGRARRLGFVSDAAHRFERGVDFAITRDAMERATELIMEICGGRAGPVAEANGKLPERKPITLRSERAARILGIQLSSAEIESLLQRQKLKFTSKNGFYEVTPPSYRFDLSLEIDLIEELARLYGYDPIPALTPISPVQMLPAPEKQRSLIEIKHCLKMRDYHEVINFSFVDAAWEANFCANQDPIKLSNPIASQMSVMRSSLIGGLLANLSYNLNHQVERVRLFEVGRCFYKSQVSSFQFPVSSYQPETRNQKLETDFYQPLKLAGLCYGTAFEEQWGVPSRQVDFYDVKADIEALLPQFRYEAAVTSAHPALHPGKSARIYLDNHLIGWLGELHPKWQSKLDLPQAPILFELELASLQEGSLPHYAECPKFPSVVRDFSILVDAALEIRALIEGIKTNTTRFVREVRLWDMYRGENIPADKKSLTFRLVMQDKEQTLTDEIVENESKKIMRYLTDNFNAIARDH